MKLSIVVPVYNMAGGGKLEYCLDSLLAQTLSEVYEIIPVDDASTDASREILKRYAAQYPDRIHPIYSDENHKQGGARNLGMAAATGEWIGFMDSDDFAHPTMFAKLLARADETGADVVGCHYHLTQKHSMEIGTIIRVNTPEQTGILTDAQYRKLLLQPGSMVIKIYRADVIRKKQLTFPSDTFYEDNQAGPLWMLSFTHFELVDEPLYAYYQNEASTVHVVNMDRLQNRMDMSLSLVRECKARGFYEKYRDELEANFTRCYYVNTLFSYVQDAVETRRKIDVSFLEAMRRGMQETFPEFQKNPYYEASYDAEQKKLMAMHMQSPRKFKLYYIALMKYRRIRYGK